MTKNYLKKHLDLEINPVTVRPSMLIFYVWINNHDVIYYSW